MPSLLRVPRMVLVVAGTLLALSAAGITVATAPVLPTGPAQSASSTDLVDYQLPTLSVADAPAE